MAVTNKVVQDVATDGSQNSIDVFAVFISLIIDATLAVSEKPYFVLPDTVDNGTCSKLSFRLVANKFAQCILSVEIVNGSCQKVATLTNRGLWWKIADGFRKNFNGLPAGSMAGYGRLISFGSGAIKDGTKIRRYGDGVFHFRIWCFGLRKPFNYTERHASMLPDFAARLLVQDFPFPIPDKYG